MAGATIVACSAVLIEATDVIAHATHVFANGVIAGVNGLLFVVKSAVDGVEAAFTFVVKKVADIVSIAASACNGTSTGGWLREKRNAE